MNYEYTFKGHICISQGLFNLYCNDSINGDKCFQLPLCNPFLIFPNPVFQTCFYNVSRCVRCCICASSKQWWQAYCTSALQYVYRWKSPVAGMYIIMENACWGIDLLEAKWKTRWIMALWQIHLMSITWESITRCSAWQNPVVILFSYSWTESSNCLVVNLKIPINFLSSFLL